MVVRFLVHFWKPKENLGPHFASSSPSLPGHFWPEVPHCCCYLSYFTPCYFQAQPEDFSLFNFSFKAVFWESQNFILSQLYWLFMCQKWSNAILHSYKYFTRAFFYLFLSVNSSASLAWYQLPEEMKIHWLFHSMSLGCSSVCLPNSGFMSNFLKIHWCLYI